MKEESKLESDIKTRLYPLIDREVSKYLRENSDRFNDLKVYPAPIVYLGETNRPSHPIQLSSLTVVNVQDQVLKSEIMDELIDLLKPIVETFQ